MRENNRKVKTGHVERKHFPFNVAYLVIWGAAPHPSRLTACHLPRRGRRPPGGGFPGGGVPLPSPGGRWPPGGGFLRRGRSLTFPWGKVAASAAGRGAVPGRTLCRPTPVTPAACHPLPGEGFFVPQAIYASRSESFLTIREVMRNSTATKAKKPHWALVVSEVAMKS